MTIRSKVACPSGLARVQLGERSVTVTRADFQETYGGVLEGAPGPEFDAELRDWLLECLASNWGPRPTHVVEPEVVEVPHPRRPFQRMPAVTCAARLVSTPLADASDASEVVLVWWTETLDLPIGALVAQALDGVRWEKVAKDFDY